MGGGGGKLRTPLTGVSRIQTGFLIGRFVLTPTRKPASKPFKKKKNKKKRTLMLFVLNVMTFYGINTLFSLNQTCLSSNGKFKTQSMHCCKQREKTTEPPQFKRTMTVERSICKNTVVIYVQFRSFVTVTRCIPV